MEPFDRDLALLRGRVTTHRTNGGYLLDGRQVGFKEIQAEAERVRAERAAEAITPDS